MSRPESKYYLRPNASETLVFFSCLFVLVVLPWAFMGGGLLFHRYFWFDEATVELISMDASLLHLIRSLLHGDTHNGPVFFLLLRGWTWMMPFSHEVSFRIFSVCSLILCSLGVYATLRKYYSPCVSAISALSLFSQERWIYFAFDGRYYGPWLAACAWHAYFLSKQDENPKSLWALSLSHLTAFFVVALHDYGVLAWIVMSSLRATYLGGAFGIVCQLPFLYGQWHSFGTWAGTWGFEKSESWLRPLGIRQILGYLSTLFFRPYFRVFLLLFLIHQFKPFKRPSRLNLFHHRHLIQLALLPILLLGLSLRVIPTPQFGYAIPATLALAPFLAMGLAAFRPWATVCFVCALVIFNCQYFSDSKQSALAHQKRYGEILAEIKSKPLHLPIIDATGLLQLPLGRYAPELSARLYYADFRTRKHRCQTMKDYPGIYSQRKLSADYPNLAMLDQVQLKQFDSFILLGKMKQGDTDRGGCYEDFKLRQIKVGVNPSESGEVHELMARNKSGFSIPFTN